MAEAFETGRRPKLVVSSKGNLTISDIIRQRSELMRISQPILSYNKSTYVKLQKRRHK